MRTREGLPFGHPGCPVTGKRAGRFVDTNTSQLIGNKRVPLLIHEAGVRILGRHFGMVDRDARSEQDEELITLRHQLEAAHAELDIVNAELDGVDALTKRGLVIRKKPGRKPNTHQEESA
jgi:hypothetical protein